MRHGEKGFRPGTRGARGWRGGASMTDLLSSYLCLLTYRSSKEIYPQFITFISNRRKAHLAMTSSFQLRLSTSPCRVSSGSHDDDPLRARRPGQSGNATAQGSGDPIGWPTRVPCGYSWSLRIASATSFSYGSGPRGEEHVLSVGLCCCSKDDWILQYFASQKYLRPWSR